MGKPRQRAVDILGLQHQSGRCGSRACGRTSKQSIANGGGPPHPEDRSSVQEAGELAATEGHPWSEEELRKRHRCRSRAAANAKSWSQRRRRLRAAIGGGG